MYPPALVLTNIFGVVFEIPVQNNLNGKVNFSDHTRGLTSLSTNIKTITAKMSLLKQDITTSLPTIPEQSQQSIFDTYDSIGQDLHSLLKDWQSGRNELINLVSSTSSSPIEHEESTLVDGEGSITDLGGSVVDEGR